MTSKALRAGAVSSPRRSTDDAKEAFADALEGGESSGAFGPEDEVAEGSLGGGETEDDDEVREDLIETPELVSSKRFDDAR